jgi:hypothetical protein
MFKVKFEKMVKGFCPKSLSDKLKGVGNRAAKVMEKEFEKIAVQDRILIFCLNTKSAISKQFMPEGCDTQKTSPICLLKSTPITRYNESEGTLHFLCYSEFSLLPFD